MSGAFAKLFRGIPHTGRAGLSQVSGLKAMERALSSARGVAERNTRGGVWASSSPDVASSYAQNGVVIPLELLVEPDAVFDARGANWREFFYPGAKSVADYRQLLNLDYADALADPMLSTIMVRNIEDIGPGFLGGATRADNYLLKDPSVVRYLLTGEEAEFAQGGSV